jgi:surface polysaccharide O-acyltransferase-like enzyme
LEPKSTETVLPVDLIRTIAIILVITLHAATENYPPSLTSMSLDAVTKWWSVNVYDALGRFGVPLFIMLSGALLLQPSKTTEPMGVFFKKRLNRIAIPFFFWSAIYFAYRFLVNGEAFSWNTIGYGLMTSPYVQFWFLYLIFGLYLITPALRVFVGNVDRRVFRFFLLLILLGTLMGPIINILGTSLNWSIFLITGWIGYYLLGAYLTRTHLSRKLLYTVLLLGISCTIIGTCFIIAATGDRFSQFFYDAFSLNVMAAAAAMFLLLWNFKPSGARTKFLTNNWLVRQISQNSLAIYFMFIIVLETLQRGLLGFRISLTLITPIVEVPLLTAVTLLICLGALLALKKIPYAKRLLG